MAENVPKAMVYATVMTVDGTGRSFNDDTELGPAGLNWDDRRKRLCFNPIRAMVKGEGCQLASSADAFQALKTVGEMVKHVISFSVRQ
jgi:hypothetical protein